MLGLVPAGAVADDVIFFDGGALRHIALDEGEGERRGVANIGSLPLADVALPAAPSTTPATTSATTSATITELASGAQAQKAFHEAVNEWMILVAGALVGIGARSLEIGVEYVKAVSYTHLPRPSGRGTTSRTTGSPPTLRRPAPCT